MNNLKYLEDALSPLDQIRQTEAEVMRRVATAQEEAEAIIAEASSQAENTIREAGTAGRREGRARYRDIVTLAQEEAQAVIAQAYKRAEILRLREQHRLPAGIRQIVSIVIGFGYDGESG